MRMEDINDFIGSILYELNNNRITYISNLLEMKMNRNNFYWYSSILRFYPVSDNFVIRLYLEPERDCEALECTLYIIQKAGFCDFISYEIDSLERGELVALELEFPLCSTEEEYFQNSLLYDHKNTPLEIIKSINELYELLRTIYYESLRGTYGPPFPRA